MRLANIRFSDWDEGTHHDTLEDDDGYLRLSGMATSGYWEVFVDLLGDSYSTIKTSSPLHPRMANYYHGQASELADEEDDPETEEDEFLDSAVDSLNWGDIVILDCPADPSDTDDYDVQICSRLASARMLYLRITPSQFSDYLSEAPTLLDEIVKNIYPHGIFLDEYGSEEGVSSEEREAMGVLVHERLLFRIWTGDDPSDFVDEYDRISTTNDFLLLKDFFASYDLDATVSQLEDAEVFPGQLIAEAPSGLDFIRVWTMATLGGVKYLADASRTENSIVGWPNIYCGSSWEDSEVQVDEGTPSRMSDTGTLTWDYRGYPIYNDESCRADIIRLWVRNHTNYYGQSSSITIAQMNESGEYETDSDPYEALPSYPTDLDDVNRYIRIRINLETDDTTFTPTVEYADVQIKYLPGLVSNFFTSTQRMTKKFPRWMAIRELESDINSLPESLGGKILNFAAGEDLSSGWEDYFWAQAQKNPASLDLAQMAWCWRVPRGINELYSLEATLGEQTISPILCNSTEEFLASLEWEDTCLWSTYGSLYFNRRYDSVEVNGEEVELEDFQVPNSLDSWGTMLDLPRLRLEDNVSYYRRIYDVCVNLPTADLEGLKRGLQRELALCSQPEAWGSSPELWGTTPEIWGSTPLGSTPYFGCTPDIIELHTLGPGDEEWFDEMGFATERLKHWIAGINKRAGITFDTMRSGKVTWDMAGPNGEAIGYLPLRFDASPTMPFGWYGSTPWQYSSTPWWEVGSTPPATPFIYRDGVLEYGVGDGNDLLVARPAPSAAPENFVLSVYVDGVFIDAYTYHPAVEIPWQARGMAEVDVYDPQPQTWYLTLFASEAATPDGDPTNWSYYSTLSGNTIYDPKSKFFDGTPAATPENLNLETFNLLSYSGPSGPAYSDTWGWDPSTPNPVDVTSYSLYNGEWSGSGWNPGTNNSSVDVWWTTLDGTPVGAEGTGVTVDLRDGATPLGDIRVASTNIGSFLYDQDYYTDYGSTPPSSPPVPFGPLARYGRVVVNGVALGSVPATPGKHDVTIWAPIFVFHPSCRNFTWQIAPSAEDALGNVIGYSIDGEFNPSATTDVSVDPAGATPYDEMTSSATFSSDYAITLLKEIPWTSEGSVDVEGQLYSEYNPKIWSAKKLLTPDDFSMTEFHFPHRFRVIPSSPDMISAWLDDDNALALDEATEATPLEVMLFAKMKDYGSLEWNPRIHSGFFYMPHNERYLYADCRQETFTSCDEEDYSVTLSSIPNAGAPVIVLDNLGRSWRKITSWDYEDGIPTMVNTIQQEMYGTDTDTLYAAYRGIADVVVTDQSVYPIEEFNEVSDFTVEDNRLVFLNDYVTDSNHLYSVSYIPEQSFHIDTQYEDSGAQKAKLYLSQDFSEAGISEITVFYEGSAANRFYTENSIRLSPLLTYWQRAFIFMQGTEQECTEVRLFASPGEVSANGLDWSIIHVVSLDADQNPVANVPILLSADLGTLASTALVTNEEGFAVTTWTSPDGLSATPEEYATIETVGETPDAYTTIALTSPVERGYSIDARTASGVRTLMSDGISVQQIIITVLDEDMEPVSGVSVSKSLWTNTSPVAATPDVSVVGDTNDKGMLLDSITSDDEQRQVFVVYYLTSDETISDSISWTEYEVFNYPESVM